MNFAPVDLDDATAAFWREAREFFDLHVTVEILEEERQGGGGFAPSLHAAMGERGWVAPTWPLSEGGAELDPVRARILDLERGRSDAPFILSATTLVPPVAIRLFGSRELQADVLPRVADGSVRICLGYTEPDCGSDLASVRTRAVRDGDEWVITGQKMFTTGAQFCQYCFCLTRTNTEVPKHKGLTVFLVPLDAPGVEIRPIGTLGGERTNFVYFDDVRVSDRYRLGGVDDGWTTVSAPLNSEHSLGKGDAEFMVSPGEVYCTSIQRAYEHILQWASNAHDQSGTPVMSDPGVRERLAAVALGMEVAAATSGPMGRVAAADVVGRAAADLLEIVGTAGLLKRGADSAVAEGVAEELYRFAPGTGIYGGSTDIHRNLIAERYLGLPRSTPRS